MRVCIFIYFKIFSSRESPFFFPFSQNRKIFKNVVIFFERFSLFEKRFDILNLVQSTDVVPTRKRVSEVGDPLFASQ
jgi:hypothetical protein